MKPTTKSALLGAVLSAAAIVTTVQFIPSRVQAQTSPPNALPKEQYKLMQISPEESIQLQEETINRLAAEGWKVRTGVAHRLIFVK